MRIPHLTSHRRVWPVAALLLPWCLAACGGGGAAAVAESAPPAPPAAAAAPGATASAPSAAPVAPITPSAPSAAGNTSTAVAAVDTQDRAAVLALHRNTIAPAFALPFTWAGSTSGCQAGDTPADFKASVVRVVNAYRVLAGLPGTVALNLQTSAQAQQAALMMQANNRLSHSPGTDWACHSAAGATAAGSSNLALGISGPGAIQLYMADRGVPNLGHRRWLLSATLSDVGTGDTAQANALWVFGQAAPLPPQAVAEGVAWPPRGYVPWSAQVAVPTDDWSLSVPGADFSGATVQMFNDQGQALSVAGVGEQPRGFGDNTVSWRLDAPAALWSRGPLDTRFTVRVSNVVVQGRARTYEYSTTFVRP